MNIPNIFFRFTWQTVSWFWSTSVAEVKWTIPENTPAGVYRIRHFGDFKFLGGSRLGRYYGSSETFKVVEK